jgi:hypothetical protein
MNTFSGCCSLPRITVVSPVVRAPRPLFHRHGNFKFPHKRIYYINHHRPVDVDDPYCIYESLTVSRTSNINKKLGIVCTLRKVCHQTGVSKKRNKERKVKSNGDVFTCVICEIELGRCGRCLACHRRDFNGRYSVVIQSIRILAGISHAIASRRWEDRRYFPTHFDLLFSALHAGTTCD